MSGTRNVQAATVRTAIVLIGISNSCSRVIFLIALGVIGRGFLSSSAYAEHSLSEFSLIKAAMTRSSSSLSEVDASEFSAPETLVFFACCFNGLGVAGFSLGFPSRRRISCSSGSGGIGLTRLLTCRAQISRQMSSTITSVSASRAEIGVTPQTGQVKSIVPLTRGFGDVGLIAGTENRKSDPWPHGRLREPDEDKKKSWVLCELTSRIGFAFSAFYLPF